MNERSLELIHGEIDGRISAREQEELRALLDADPKLREIRSELQKLAQSLGQVQPLDPPAGLRARILNAIRPPPVAPPGSRPGRCQPHCGTVARSPSAPPRPLSPSSWAVPGKERPAWTWPASPARWLDTSNQRLLEMLTLSN